MIYPLNLFTPDPVTNSIRPFCIILGFEIQSNLLAMKTSSDPINIRIPKLGFALPMPNTGVIDSHSNEYTNAPGLIAGLASSFVEGKVSKNVTSQLFGFTMNPDTISTYNGTALRTYTGTWQLVPQSRGESAAISLILWMIKISSAPAKADIINTIGILIQPYSFKIIFSNPLIHLGASYDDMVLNSYTINYFAQGYSSTYSDMFPKQIELTMNFTERHIKYREDWDVLGIF